MARPPSMLLALSALSGMRFANLSGKQETDTTNGDAPKGVSRRTFIKGVIAGAAVAFANYL